VSAVVWGGSVVAWRIASIAELETATDEDNPAASDNPASIPSANSATNDDGNTPTIDGMLDNVMSLGAEPPGMVAKG
jgi:hypothetical protein